MEQKIFWKRILGGAEYLISYDKMTFFGSVLISIDGKQDKYTPVYRKEDGYWVIFYCGQTECLMNISHDRNTARVLVQSELEGIPEGNAGEAEAFSAESPAPGEEIPEPVKPQRFEAVDLNQKVRNGTGSFFTLLILSLINLPLIYGNVSISFPFSIFSSMVAAGFGISASEESGGDMVSIIISLSIAISIILFYGILYYFSFRSNPVIWVSFGFLIADTLLLVGFAFLSGSAGELIIDIAFHAWILWSIFRFGVAKGKLKKVLMNRIPAFTVEMACCVE